MKEPKQTPIEDLAELRSYFASHNGIREYIAHSSKVHSVGWSCDGRRLASGSYDKNVAIFTLERSRLSQDYLFRGHTGSVDQLCWHASHADLLSTASGDKSVRIWDTRSHKCAAIIATKGENINIAWSPNGSTIAVGNKEDLVSFIDTRTYKVVVEEQFNFEVNEISWNLSSDLFYLTNGLGCVHIMTYPSLELQTVLKAHPGTCICVEHDPTGRYFATGSADALVSLWDVHELACLRVFSRYCYMAVFSKITDTQELQRWEQEVGKKYTATPRNEKVSAVQDLRQGFLRDLSLATSYILSTLLTQGAPTATLAGLQTVLKAHPGTCICVEHDPTGRYFATGSADALVSLWDVHELACLRVFSRLEWPVRTLSFSFDGRLLASASEDHIIDIGDTETGEKVAEIPVSASTFTVAWHPSRYLAAFACEDKEPPERKRDAGSLKLWGLPKAG